MQLVKQRRISLAKYDVFLKIASIAPYSGNVELGEVIRNQNTQERGHDRFKVKVSVS